MRTCQQCGKELPATAHRNKKICAECCAQRQSIRFKRRYEKLKADPVAYAKYLENYRKNKAKHKAIELHTCMSCGRRFKPNYKGEKYCSRECYSESPLRKNFLEFLNQKNGTLLSHDFFYEIEGV